MKIRNLLLVTFLAFTTASFLRAQDLNNFTRLESKGAIPRDFLELSSEKIKTDQASNTNEDLDMDFFLSTRFGLDELLLSGQILFNEDLSNYVNEVAKYTLQSEKGLINELRFYVLRSNEVNAYSTDQGIIFFTTGLLAQLENEAQLAYIIAHESAHYIFKHVRESYVESKVILSKKGKNNLPNNIRTMRQLSSFQKENELDADKKGIQIYLKSEYHVEEIFSSFEMLLYSYLPYDERDFDSTFFNTEILKIPAVYFPDTTNAITMVEDYDDEYHTHPNIKTRIDSALYYLGDTHSQGNLKYKVSETEFVRIRNLARFEGLNLMLAERRYVRALYTLFLLKNEFPTNRFLDLCLVKALYGLTKYKNAARYQEVTEDLSEVEGDSFIVHYLFDKMDQIALNIIAYRHAYDLSVKYPNDPTFALYEKDLKRELALNSGLKFEDLQSSSYDTYIAEMIKIAEMDKINGPTYSFDFKDSLAAIEKSPFSKYEKIRLKKSLNEFMIKPTDEDTMEHFPYYFYGLYDLVSNGNFISELKMISEAANQNEELAALESRIETSDESDSTTFDKLVIFDPTIKYFENKDRNKENYTKGEDQKMKSLDYLQKGDSNFGLDWVLIDSKLLEEKSVAEYNEIGLISQWRQEVVANGGLEMISSSSDLMQDLEKKYGTTHFLFVTFLGYKEANKATPLHTLGLAFPFTTLFVIADVYIKRKRLSILAYSINTSSDQMQYLSDETIKVAANWQLINLYLYNVLYNVNKPQ